MISAPAISKLTLPQKLKLMEDLWAELSRTPETVPTPDWHLEVLVERQKLVQQGKAKFHDWADVKKRLQRRKKQ
jgi:hypothetical protein